MLALQTSCRAIGDAAKVAAESLAKMVERFNAIHRALPVIRTSQWMPRGQTFEYDEPKLFGPVVLMHPDGRIEYETRRVLVVNDEDFREVIEG